MAGTENVGDIAVILAALVLIFYQKRNRGAGSFSLINTGQDFDGIRFTALCDETGSTGFAAIQFRLDIVFRQVHTRRAAIDNTANGRAVRFAERRYRKQFPERIACHSVIRKEFELT